MTEKNLLAAAENMAGGGGYGIGTQENYEAFVKARNYPIPARIYSAEYNSCVYESGFTTISLHSTKKGAEKAIREHKESVLADWKESGYNDCPDWEQWQVRPIEMFGNKEK